MLPYIIFGVCHKHNSLPLGPIQPSSPSSKELHYLHSSLFNESGLLPTITFDNILANGSKWCWSIHLGMVKPKKRFKSEAKLKNISFLVVKFQGGGYLEASHSTSSFYSFDIILHTGVRSCVPSFTACPSLSLQIVRNITDRRNLSNLPISNHSRLN